MAVLRSFSQITVAERLSAFKQLPGGDPKTAAACAHALPCKFHSMTTPDCRCACSMTMPILASLSIVADPFWSPS